MATYRDEDAILDHLLEGKALPPHLARSRTGEVLPRTPHATAKAIAEEQKAANDRRAALVAEKMAQSPLVAICFKHLCGCGASWQAFGFFARKVTDIPLERAGQATFHKPVSVKPVNEVITETIWQTVNEETCLSCFTAVQPVSGEAQPSPSPVVLSQYRHKAAEEVDAIRTDAIEQRRASYLASAVKRVMSALPYGLEDAVPALPELAAQLRKAADAE